MPNQQILDYLNQNKDKYSLDQLKQGLISSGYPETEINEAISLLFATESPQIAIAPPPPPKKSWWEQWWGVVLLFLLFGLLGWISIYLIWNSQKLSRPVKWALSIVMVILSLFLNAWILQTLQ